MKPSIFIMTKYKLINLNEFSNDQIYLDKLDKRFIDREELKDKINNIADNIINKTRSDIEMKDIIIIDKSKIIELWKEYKKEILELLK